MRFLTLPCFFVGLVLAFQSASWAHDIDPKYESLIREVNLCSSTKSDKRRLECFDSINQKGKEVETEIKPEKLPETLGGRKFDSSSREDQAGSRGRVKSCKKSHDGKWFFIFENGQVWKQVDADHRRYKECNFSVTIKKDGFGYKMQIDGQTRKIRIKRHR